MRITEVILKHFGKFTDQTIDFSDGINLLYGENESGKSTVHTFIRSMLFGLERGRGKASLTDTFSQYEPWEDPGYYAGVLKFTSGGKDFVINRHFDKYAKSAQLFCESDGEELSIPDGDLTAVLGGLTEDVYANTVSIGQLKAAPDQKLSDALKNFSANYYASGDADLDLSAAYAHLKTRRNAMDKAMDKELQETQRKRDQIEQESAYIWRDVHKLNEEISDLDQEIKERKQQDESNRADEAEKASKWRIHPLLILAFALLIVLCFVLIPKPWGYLVTIVVFLLCGIYVWNRMKVGRKPEAAMQKEAVPLDRLLGQRDRMKAELKDKEIQYENLKEQLEELEEVGSDFREWETTRSAVEMAEAHLKTLSGQMQEQMKQVIGGRVSEIVEAITGGKYSRLMVENDFSVSLWQEDHKVSARCLSRGTIEQIYFAMRMASAEMMQTEDYPILLDDTFAYYDEERLERTLQWLAENKKQVLLFTCQRREKEALDRLQIPYREIRV